MRLKYKDNDSKPPSLYIPIPTYEIPNPNVEITAFCNYAKRQAIRKLENINITYKHKTKHTPTKQSLDIHMQGLHELCKNEQIRVMQADKNLGFTVLDNDIFIRETNRHLNDTNTYRQINLDIYNDLKKQYLTQQTNLINSYDNILDHTVLTFMDRIVDNYTIPKFKVLAKIHKLKNLNNLDALRFRNIIPNFNSYTMPLSRVLDYMINDYINNTHILKDTHTLVKHLDILQIPANSFLVSMDFESLFTNIPIYDSINTIRIFLLENGVNLDTINFICEGARLVFTNNIFVSEDKRYFLQIAGLAMGSQVVPKWANLYLYQKEKEYVKHYAKCIYFTRLIDDVFCVVEGTEKEVLDFINGYRQLFTIGITHELNFHSIVMLDVIISKGAYGTSLEVKTYEKPTNNHLYITQESFHAKHTLKGLILGQLRRYIITNSKAKWYYEQRESFYEHLRNRGYRYKLLYPLFRQLKYSDRHNILHTPKIKNNRRKCIAHVYNTALTQELGLGGIIHSAWNSFNFSTEITDNLDCPMISFKRTANVQDVVNKLYANKH